MMMVMVMMMMQRLRKCPTSNKKIYYMNVRHRLVNVNHNDGRTKPDECYLQ